jgi:hypothetical protein
MLIIGLIALIRTHPDISDKTLKDIAAQTLRLDIKKPLPGKLASGKLVAERAVSVAASAAT